MIMLENVTKVYDLGKGSSVTAVRGVSLEIGSGEFAAIVGRSGSGKTTLLNLAAGLTRPTSGRVTLDGVELWKTERSAAVNHAEPKDWVRLSVSKPAADADGVRKRDLAHHLRIERSARPDVARAGRSLLHKVGLSDKLTAYPRQLSAGQQQRVVIARSLINQPQLLLADEPTSNLDEKTEMEIMGLFRDLHASLGLTVVLVTHTRQLISPGMRSIEMAEGRIVGRTTAGAQGIT